MCTYIMFIHVCVCVRMCAVNYEGILLLLESLVLCWTISEGIASFKCTVGYKKSFHIIMVFGILLYISFLVFCCVRLAWCNSG